MAGRTCVVTGGSTGIGRATALALADSGARVVLVCRNRERGESAVAHIRQATGSEADLHLADLSAQASVRRLARDLLARYPRIDVLVNNAGVFRRVSALSEEGFDSTFATNHLGPFLLTNLLLERMLESAPSRIVNLTSDLHRRAEIDPEQPEGSGRYSAMAAYNRSKLANLLFTRELARRIEGRGVDVNAVHPGAVATRIAQQDGGLAAIFFRLARPFLLRPEQGADSVVWLASSSEAAGVTGRYFIKRREVEPSETALDETLARRLWETSEKLAPVNLD
jgi:NAD(P)-dependent dehydrogenase (short-subunit alcohol dehydrogenase family)